MRKNFISGALVGLFLLFAFWHFFGLAGQEFTGDEASPMLLIDRAWDAISTKDLRLIAYPFLFYHEPFREIFSGTLLHFFGVNRLWLRLPSIFFDLLSFWCLVYFWAKEKVKPAIILAGAAVYATAPWILVSRLAFSDGQAKLLILISAYFIWKKRLIPALWLFLAAFLTVLDAAVLLPALATAGLSLKAWRQPKFLRQAGLVLGLTGLYLAAWLALPYLAYQAGWQEHWLNRGLFYYLGRVGEGITANPRVSLQILNDYSNPLLVLWLVLTNFSRLNILTLPAWIAVIALNSPSIHILSFTGLFLFQAILVTNQWLKNHSRFGWPAAIFFGTLMVLNLSQMRGHFQNPRRNQQIDEAVIRIYQEHGKIGQ